MDYIITIKSPFSYGFPIVFLWFSNGNHHVTRLFSDAPGRCHSLRRLRHPAGRRAEFAAPDDAAQLATDLCAAPGQVPPAGAVSWDIDKYYVTQIY